MGFMMLYERREETTAPPSQKEMADMGQLIEEMAKAGVLLATDGRSRARRGSASWTAGSPEVHVA